MNIFRKKVLAGAMTALLVGVLSGCDSDVTDAAVNAAEQAQQEATGVADQVQQEASGMANQVQQEGAVNAGAAAVNSALQKAKEEVTQDNVLSNFDTLTTNNEQGVVESKPVSAELDAGWKSLKTTGVRVIDGDTVEVLIDGAQSERIRLIGIDAPESSQEYGTTSAETLERCIADKRVSIVYKEKDQYERILGKVVAGNTDCNFYQVGVGSAWHYKQYQDEQPNDDKFAYSDAEKVARMHSQGLWQSPEPQEPWEYRREN